MKNKIKSFFQDLGTTLMVPISVLPLAGLFIAVGSFFTGEQFSAVSLLKSGSFLNILMFNLNKVGLLIFSLLPFLFCVGAAYGLAKKDKEVAAFSSLLAYFVMILTIGSLISFNESSSAVMEVGTQLVFGLKTLDTGFFGGLVLGVGVSVLHNRFYKLEFPQPFNFFGGTRFIPLVSIVLAVFVGWGFFLLWPVLHGLLIVLGNLVLKSGYFGTFIFGIIKRLLIPLGLHHVFYMPFWQTSIGGSMAIAGQVVNGGQNIIFAQMAAQSATHFSVDASRFFSGEFIFMLFGLPGAALAMFRSVSKKKRKSVKPIYISALIACLSLGVTEPIEFMFMLISPLLFKIHILYAGIAYMLAHVFNVAVGITFSGGLLDFVLYGVLQGNERTSWMVVPVIGVFYFGLYYFTFSIVVKKRNVQVPGRKVIETETVEDESLVLTIVQGLGGQDNISSYGSCATRLRINVKDEMLINQDVLRSTGALGLVVNDKNVQLVFGPKVTAIKTDLDEYLN